MIFIRIASLVQETSYFMKIIFHLFMKHYLQHLFPPAPAPGSFSGDHHDPIVEITAPHTLDQTLSNSEPSDNLSPPQLHRSTRTRHAPTYLQDYHRDFTSLTANASTTIRYPLHSVLSYSRLSPSHFHFVMSISSTTEPTSYAEASRHDYWIKAMNAELEALELNHTWTLTSLYLSLCSKG